MKPSTRFALGLAIANLAIFIWSLTFNSVEMKALPLAVSGILFLATVQFVREFKARDAETKPSTASGATAKKPGGRYLAIAAWLIGLYVGIYAFGFLVAVPIFIFSYLKLHQRGWFAAIGFAAVFLLIMYGVFIQAMRVQLYPGQLFLFLQLHSL